MSSHVVCDLPLRQGAWTSLQKKVGLIYPCCCPCGQGVPRGMHRPPPPPCLLSFPCLSVCLSGSVISWCFPGSRPWQAPACLHVWTCVSVCTCTCVSVLVSVLFTHSLHLTRNIEDGEIVSGKRPGLPPSWPGIVEDFDGVSSLAAVRQAPGCLGLAVISQRWALWFMNFLSLVSPHPWKAFDLDCSSLYSA